MSTLKNLWNSALRNPLIAVLIFFGAGAAGGSLTAGEAITLGNALGGAADHIEQQIDEAKQGGEDGEQTDGAESQRPVKEGVLLRQGRGDQSGQAQEADQALRTRPEAGQRGGEGDGEAPEKAVLVTR